MKTLATYLTDGVDLQSIHAYPWVVYLKFTVPSINDKHYTID